MLKNTVFMLMDLATLQMMAKLFQQIYQNKAPWRPDDNGIFEC